jgi:ATP/maltotriose-dependent transcriptional regulator MalT
MFDQKQYRLGFHVNRPFAISNPVDALHEAAAVASMLNHLLVQADDFPERDGSINGLTILLEGIEDTINDAAEAINASYHTCGEYLTSHVARESERLDADLIETEAPIEAELNNVMESTDDEQAEKTNAAAPARLTAREAAIAAVVGQGYELEDIAKAVNLKKVTVQRIIDQLSGGVALKPTPTEARYAGRATA